MKTPMNIYNTAMKKKKNRKGFSLVELIVVLVIMAILAAALIPSLTGYIKKTKQQNINSECQSAVQAAQTIILLQMMIMLKQLQNWQSARQVIKHPQLQLLLMRMVVYQD